MHGCFVLKVVQLFIIKFKHTKIKAAFKFSSEPIMQVFAIRLTDRWKKLQRDRSIVCDSPK